MASVCPHCGVASLASIGFWGDDRYISAYICPACPFNAEVADPWLRRGR